MEKGLRSCALAVLAVCVGWLSVDVSRAQTPPARPSKIAVRVPPRAFGVGDEVNLLIGLMDANNQVAESDKSVGCTGGVQHLSVGQDEELESAFQSRRHLAASACSIIGKGRNGNNSDKSRANGRR
jgi:hypothetical protein